MTLTPDDALTKARALTTLIALATEDGEPTPAGVIPNACALLDDLLALVETRWPAEPASAGTGPLRPPTRT